MGSPQDVSAAPNRVEGVKEMKVAGLDADAMRLAEMGKSAQLRY